MKWIVEQLSSLAEALGEKATVARLLMNANSLADLPKPALERAFARAHRECRFFPKPAELREFAVGNVEDRETVEANAAWEWILNFMRRFWHPDIGIYNGAPVIPPATMYALRQVGGFRSLSQMEHSSEPFMKRDFIAAYKLAPVAELMRPQLRDLLPEQTVKRLTSARTMERREPIDFTALKQQAADKERRDSEARARRMEDGRKRHEEQVKWLKEKGLL